jgi:hypothetical protein
MEIKTAEEFFDSQVGYKQTEMLNKAIEFAKFHVEKALLMASEKAELESISDYDIIVNKDSILNAYSLDEIK